MPSYRRTTSRLFKHDRDYEDPEHYQISSGIVTSFFDYGRVTSRYYFPSSSAIGLYHQPQCNWLYVLLANGDQWRIHPGQTQEHFEKVVPLLSLARYQVNPTPSLTWIERLREWWYK